MTDSTRPTLGILAGMGPASTGPFLDLVYQACRDQYGARHDGDFPKMMVCSQPAPFFHDRAIDHDAVEAATIEGLQSLERAGARLIAIACNSVHAYYDRLAASVGVPVLDIVEAALDALPAGTRTVAFCTSRPLTAAGLYPQRAARRGLKVVAAEPWQPEVDRLQDLMQQGSNAVAAASLWQRLFEIIKASGKPDAIVVACLDLSATVPTARTLAPVLLVDAAAALAARLVSSWRGMARAHTLDRQVATTRGPFVISTDRDRLDIDAIHKYLTRSYWAEGISQTMVARSIAHSLCFGLFEPEGSQVGFARVVTDMQTFAYVCDVYVLESMREIGLGKELVQAVVDHPVLRRVRRAMLVTRDAHGLYRPRGFAVPAHPERFLEIVRPDPYLRPAG